MAHLTVTVVGTVVVLLAGGLGLGTGYALVTGDGHAVLRLTGAVLALVPGVLVLGALAGLLTGLAPRWASLAWLGTGFCVAVMLFGRTLQFPVWVMDVSPFSHLASLPAEPMSWPAFAVVLLVAVLAGTAGVAAFDRRDLR
jgi:ABC-2 type transport system permease protein